MAAPNWSELPCELLNLISQHFDIEIDLIRFRSVCSNWRSSSIQNLHHHILPFKVPLFKVSFDDTDSINNNNNITSFCYLSKQNIYLIKPPPQQQQTLPLCSWLIRISQNSTGKTQLLHPLLPSYSPLPFHHVIDFNKFNALHLGTNFTIDNQSYGDDYIYPQKVVAATSHGEKPLVFGKSYYYYIPKFLLFKCDDENWKVITEMQTNLGDICLFKGQPYAVDDSGRTIRVGPDNSSVQLVAEPLVDGGGLRKLLVESEGDLLLADIHDRLYIDFPCHDPISIDLFKLNEKEKKWVKLTNLGDRVLFLGECCSFTVSASDLCGSKGNCVILLDELIESWTKMRPETCILHLDEGRLSLLSDDPEYSNLFWPPPEWIVKSC